MKDKPKSKPLRRVIFWCHLPIGVCAGIVILIMSVTGVLLAYERQITAWADTRGYGSAPPNPAAPRLPVENLLERAQAARPNSSPTTFTLRNSNTAPAEIGFGREATLFVDPYSGQVLGEGSPRVRSFFRGVTDLHRWLGASGDNRPIGKAITGACNLGFLFLVVSGFYLWWPRQWKWAQIRNVTWFRRGLPRKARDFNWHNVIGFWSAIPLFIIVISAVTISYAWAGNLVYRLAGETPPAARPATSPPTTDSASRSKASQVNPQSKWTGINQLWKSAEQQVSDWKSISLRLPTGADANLVFTIDKSSGGQPQNRAQLTLDSKTGEMVRWEPFSAYSLGRRIRSVLRFAHTGEIAGVAGQTVAGLVSAGGAFLICTGLMLAFRRLRGWIRRKKDESELQTLVDAPSNAGAD